MQSFLHRLSGSTLLPTVVYAANALRQRFIIVFVLLNNDIFETFATRVCVYCAFHKHANSEVQKPTGDCVFRCRQSS